MSKAQCFQALRQIPGILTGRIPSKRDLSLKILMAIGRLTLKLVRKAFLTKSKGEVGEDGVRWQDILPKTKAYGRKHPESDGSRRPTLTGQQDKLWRQLFTQTYQMLMRISGGDHVESSARAAGHAWEMLKLNGATTLLEMYGDSDVPIGIDSEKLINSLAEHDEHNILRAGKGYVEAGSDVEYAAKFHQDRPLWPEEFPSEWIRQMEEELKQGVREIVRELLSPYAI